MMLPIKMFIYFIFKARTSLALEIGPSIATLARKLSNSHWELIEDSFDLKDYVTVDRIRANIFQKVNKLYQAFRELERPILSTSFEDVGIIIKNTNSRFVDISKLLNSIEQVDYSFERLAEHCSEDGNTLFKGERVNTLIDFSVMMTSSQASSVKSLTKTIHDLISPARKYRGRSGLLKWLATSSAICNQLVRNMQQSPQQLLYNFFNKIVLTQIKGYVILQFSYSILDLYQGTFEPEIRLAKNDLQYRLKIAREDLKEAMAVAPGEYWRFDPDEYKNGENYLKITGLMQGYIVNETILNRGEKCNGSCDFFNETKITTCQKDSYCRTQRICRSNLYDCRPLKAMDMDICATVTSTLVFSLYLHIHICIKASDSDRRYQYIRYKDRTVLGQISTYPACFKTTVPGSIKGCSYCMCLCDDADLHSDRYISLRHAMSNTNANKVVTGVRFVKKNRLIHLQVQQGEMLPYGIINVATLEWVPIDNFTSFDRLEPGKQDYFMLGKNRNAVDLHINVVTKETPKRVVTGVGFFVLETDSNTHLSLQIHETAFDFETGKLYPNSHQWTRNLQTEFSHTDRRTKIPIDDVDVPTRTTTENIVRSARVQSVEFTPTSLEKDLAQTTVPFIDAQEVVPSAPTPLIGAGLYYKTAKGYGGFIGLKIVTYDFTDHL
ncbi:hypothetical protein Trydic_g18721 [Trypoxylus dichotomus]